MGTDLSFDGCNSINGNRVCGCQFLSCDNADQLSCCRGEEGKFQLHTNETASSAAVNTGTTAEAYCFFVQAILGRTIQPIVEAAIQRLQTYKLNITLDNRLHCNIERLNSFVCSVLRSCCTRPPVQS